MTRDEEKLDTCSRHFMKLVMEYDLATRGGLEVAAHLIANLIVNAPSEERDRHADGIKRLVPMIVDEAIEKGRGMDAGEPPPEIIPPPTIEPKRSNGGEAITEQRRRRMVPEGHVDEAIVEKLVESFGLGVFNECMPTGLEIINAAMRILTLGVHARLTNGNPSATTPEIEARMHKFAKALHDVVEAADRERD
jgi:hypothetical protein